jgi:MYXO-CTERM domain-containing protein
MNNKILKSVMALVSFAPALATADILLHIDTINDEFWFSGSATGTLYDAGIETQIKWINTAEVAGDAFAFGQSGAFTIGGSQPMTFDMTIFDVDNTLDVTLYDVSSTPSGELVAISSTVFNYTDAFGGLTVSQEEAFESLIGQTIPLNLGTGFGGLTVVPEPSEVAAAFGLLALTGAFLGRRKMKA